MSSGPTLLETIYLHPAQMCFCAEPSRVETVLGSCVAVTMWNPRLQIASICHAVLPCRRQARDDAAKYVDSSIERMLKLFVERGSLLQEIEVKLFGGASMTGTAPAMSSVGQQNIEAAVVVLEREGLAPRVRDTGGNEGRKLRFYSTSGEVYVKRIRLEA